MIDQDMTPVVTMLITCVTFLGVLAVGYWVEERRKKRKSPSNVMLIRFYSREMCKAARAIQDDDNLEEQAQNLIKSINKEWNLKRTGEDDGQSACTW